MASADRLTAEALGRVLSRYVAAGKAIAYPDLLLETAAELECLEERLRREARSARRARKRVRAALVQIAEFGVFDMALPGPPSWHPEHSEHPESL